MAPIRIPMSRRIQASGFSLTELIVAVSVISILAVIAAPSLRSMSRANELRAAARRLAGDVQRARGMVLSGRQDFSGWVDTDRTRHAGIRIVDPTRYELFADRDLVANGAASEAIVETRNLAASLEVSGAQSEIRFDRKGTLETAVEVEFTLRDVESGAQQTVRVSFGGKTDIVR